MNKNRYANVMKKAVDLIHKEEWQSAIEELRLAETEFPDDAIILTAIGNCLIHLSKPEDAVDYFKRVTNKEPGSVEAFNNLGVAYMFGLNFSGAEDAYLQALQLSPGHAQTIKNLAFLYYQLENRLGDAATLLAGLVKNDPSDCEALFLMGQCYEMGEDPNSARMCYERILKYQPDSIEANESLKHLDSQKQTAAGV